LDLGCRNDPIDRDLGAEVDQPVMEKENIARGMGPVVKEICNP